MDLIFWKRKSAQKNMNFIFFYLHASKSQKAQETWIGFLASWKKLKKQGFNFVLAKKAQKLVFILFFVKNAVPDVPIRFLEDFWYFSILFVAVSKLRQQM